MKRKNGAENNQQVFKSLVQNARKGTPYFIKLVNDPMVYRAIPLVQLGFDFEKDHKVFMKIVRPAGHKGVYRIDFNDLEMMEQIPVTSSPENKEA